MMWQLVVKLGKRKGASWPITDKTLVLGRSRECDVTVRDPQVSRRHCALTCANDLVQLHHLASDNATLVNGRPVTDCALHVGDELSIGGASFIIARGHDVDDPDSRTDTPPTTRMRELRASRRGKSDATQPEFQARPRNMRDLVTLHDLATDLADCRNERDVATAILACVAESIPIIKSALICQISKHGVPNVYPAASSWAKTQSAGIRQCMEIGRPVVQSAHSVAGTGQDGAVCLVPLPASSKTIGVLAFERQNDGAADVDADVGFALAIARTCAPFLYAVGMRSNAGQGTFIEKFSSSRQPVLVGESAAIRQVRKLVGMAAQSDLPIIIQGETGTGKELIAKLIHELSHRAKGPFVGVNCATIPDTLFESEFFGHVKGAFTGATEARHGLMKEAHRGVLFLDEILDLAATNQARLLRAIETGTFRPIGSSAEISADVRVLTAANQDVLDAVEQGGIREDLYYRLCGFEITVPPLRNRREDTPMLVNYFMDMFAGELRISRPVVGEREMDFLAALPWPGNIRQLRNFVRRIMSLSLDTVTVETLRAFLDRSNEPRVAESESVESVERAHIAKMLESCGGRISEAAEILGLHRNTLRRKIKQYGL